MRPTGELLPLSANPKDAEVTLAQHIPWVTSSKLPPSLGLNILSSGSDSAVHEAGGRGLNTPQQDAAIPWVAGIVRFPLY